MLVFSCSKDETGLIDKNPYSVEKDNYTFLKNADTYQEVQRKRLEDGLSDFEIEKVERTGNSIEITVLISNQCTVNEFEVIWDGNIMESYPPQTRIFVNRITDGCNDSGETETMVLVVDLEELIFKDNDPQLEEAIVIVSNASKKPNTQNADIPVSANAD